MKLTLPFPPSVNGYWRSTKQGMKISAFGRSFRINTFAAVVEQLKRAPQPITVDVEVNVVLYPPDKRRRDLDNYQKALFDSLTHAGIWGDDSQIKRFTVEWGELTKGGRAELTIIKF
jgi:crossover junction endodeoxyribonuclease RusA